MAGNHENSNLVGGHSKERGDIRTLALFLFDFCFCFFPSIQGEIIPCDSRSRYLSPSLGSFPRWIPLESYRPMKFTGHISLRSSPVQNMKGILFVGSLLRSNFLSLTLPWT